jgi:hypothetical protein
VGAPETAPDVFHLNFGGGVGPQPCDAFVAKIVVPALTARGVQTDMTRERKFSNRNRFIGASYCLGSQ